MDTPTTSIKRAPLGKLDPATDIPDGPALDSVAGGDAGDRVGDEPAPASDRSAMDRRFLAIERDIIDGFHGGSRARYRETHGLDDIDLDTVG